MSAKITGPDRTLRPSGALPLQPNAVVIGGGASGVLMALQLLSSPDRSFRVTLIEPSVPGQGVAYATEDPGHLLNTRVLNMSAYPDRPEHFLDWLAARPEGKGVTAQCFVSRATYGDYLAGLLDPWRESTANRLRILQQEAVRVQDRAGGVVVHLNDGQTVIGDIALLATGHVHESPDPGVEPAWGMATALDPEGRVVIVGSGLSMVDRVVTLLRQGHQGEILVVSRRGLLPRAHAHTRPLVISRTDVPLGAPIRVLLTWARKLAAEAVAQGGTWRDAVDGIRPHVQAIWRSLSGEERARFLRHAAVWWDVHRHRIPAETEGLLSQARASGQLRLQRAAYLGAKSLSSGPAAVVRPSGRTVTLPIPAQRIFDCRGIRRDPEHNASPLIADLLARGRAKIDPLRIGLQVDQNCRLIDSEGQASDRLLAIGPVSRAGFWEITAIPDIRDQTKRLAAELALL